ncbi:MAG: TRAP transporter small permease [Alphaproteobacteria bacterium]|nr:TRAP transporter small permease [Alphaproteobacteria bacterium]
MRRVLDALYWGSGALACVFMAGIAVMILAQIGGRMTGILVPSADDLSGYSMGASTFFALAYSLRRGGHIRVSLLLQRLPAVPRRWAELWCLSVATAMTGYASWWCTFMAWESYELGDVSAGVVAIPLWMPQLAMCAGVTLLCVAFVDDLVAVIAGRTPSYETTDATLLESEHLGDVSHTEPAR